MFKHGERTENLETQWKHDDREVGDGFSTSCETLVLSVDIL